MMFMKLCLCGCGARIELRHSSKVNEYTVNSDKGDLIRICTNQIKGQVIPRLHFNFEVTEKVTCNGAKVYNRYEDVIHDGDFNSYDCPCMLNRTPL